MHSLRLPVFGIVIITLLLTLGACRKEMSSDGEDADQSKVCREITAKADAEKLALVQPPALSRVALAGGGFTGLLPVPADSQMVLGVNLAAFHKAGFMDQAAKLIPPWFLAQNALTFLGLSPGRSVQAMVSGLSMDSKSWVPSRAVVALTGSFKAAESVEHIHNIAGRLPNLELPPISREGQALVVNTLGQSLRIHPHGEKVILVANHKDPDTRLSADAELGRLLAPIPRDTAIWFACAKVPRDLPEMPKVISRLVSQLEQFSGYFNIDDQQNAEFQIRLRFQNAESAKQAKELIRLGLSQGLLALGPRVQKSFCLDGSTDHESVVSRGRFVRILFRMDRFQTQFMIQWVLNTLKETGHWTFGRDSVMNASSGPVVNP